jgi:hypothetical protein
MSTITIGVCKIINNVCSLMNYCFIFIPLIKGFIKINDNLINTLTTCSFLICLIFGLIFSIDNLLLLNYHIKNYKKTIFTIDYDNDIKFGYWYIIKNIIFIIMVLNSFYLIQFIPIKNNNCHGYDIDICNCGRIFGIWGIIILIIIGIFILCIGYQIYNKNTRRHNVNLILKYIQIIEEDCPICMSSDLELNIVETNCGHKFHEDCIKTYGTYNNKCPVCRQDLTNNDIVNLHEIVVQV